MLRWIFKLAILFALLAGGLYLFRDTYFCRALLRDGLVYALQRRFPEAQIVIRDLHTDFFHRLRLDGLSLRRGTREVFLDRLEADYSLAGLRERSIERIVLRFDRGAIESKEVTGKLHGQATLGIKQGRIDTLQARLVSVDEGGRMNIGLLNNLMNYMPKNLTREQLKGALAGSGAFQYERAELEVRLASGTYKIRLFLKGYHILEFTVSVPQELVGELIKLKEI